MSPPTDLDNGLEKVCCSLEEDDVEPQQRLAGIVNYAPQSCSLLSFPKEHFRVTPNVCTFRTNYKAP